MTIITVLTFINHWRSLLSGLTRQVICACMSSGVVAVECPANPIVDEQSL